MESVRRGLRGKRRFTIPQALRASSPRRRKLRITRCVVTSFISLASVLRRKLVHSAVPPLRFKVIALKREGTGAAKARSLRCSSYPNRTHFVGLRFGDNPSGAARQLPLHRGALGRAIYRLSLESIDKL